MGTYSLTESVALGRSRDKLRALQLLSRKNIGMPVTSFAHDVHNTKELIKLVDDGGDPISPARAGHRVVEILIGFLESHRRGNVRVDLPIPRGELSTG